MRHHSTHHQPRLLSVVLCVPTQPHPSMLLCRPVCPAHSHRVQSLPLHHTIQRLCCFHPSPLVSCVRPTHSTTSTPHHTRFQCPISQWCHIAPPPCSTHNQTCHVLHFLVQSTPKLTFYTSWLFNALVVLFHSLFKRRSAIVIPICLLCSSSETSLRELRSKRSAVTLNLPCEVPHGAMVSVCIKQK